MDNIINKYDKTISEIENNKMKKGDVKSINAYINHMDHIKKKLKSD